jgi:hypothetical protein
MKKSSNQKQSSVIKPGTGSGSRPNGGGKYPIKTSAPEDKHGLHRKPGGKVLK